MLNFDFLLNRFSLYEIQHISSGAGHAVVFTGERTLSVIFPYSSAFFHQPNYQFHKDGTSHFTIFYVIKGAEAEITLHSNFKLHKL